ncbi:MAG: transcription elongation factor GreA [Candidatus Parcubacteria bacterium]|nr:transcription elongation factor GreA [Candidatus Parcubacteria bacterium]
MEKYLTPEGLKKLKNELHHLKEVERKGIADRLEESLAYGDISENAEYQEAKEAQGFLEGKISDLEFIVNSAVVVRPVENTKFVQIGSTITISSKSIRDKFRLVGIEEANPMEGRISADSPLGQAVFNKIEGAIIDVSTPQGVVKYKILKVE